jgi:hypothetical protein
MRGETFRLLGELAVQLEIRIPAGRSAHDGVVGSLALGAHVASLLLVGHARSLAQPEG